MKMFYWPVVSINRLRLKMRRVHITGGTVDSSGTVESQHYGVWRRDNVT